ncbi:unnamed protein product [Paramecium primaurelia]|uniref:Tetratricopeptide repeat protein n=1 Tax=Paramecium primaurelia TaxID=5886 RepID=A0A8S1PPK9_PARPR|nr:unnamed protein product [Paramecium primaurelia]
MFFCQNLEHEGSQIIGFCLYPDCQEPKSQFCVNCLINPQKHLNCRNDCKPFDKIDILLDLIIYKLDQMLEQADWKFQQFKLEYEKTIKIILKEQQKFQEIAKNLKVQKCKDFLDNIGKVKFWNTNIKSTQFEKEIINLWLKQGIELINQKEYQRALVKFEKVLQEDANNHLAKFYQSILKQKQGVTLMQQNNNYKSFQLLKELQLEYPNFQEQALITLQEKLRIKSNNIATLILQVYCMIQFDKKKKKIDIDQNIMIYCDIILGLDKYNVFALGMKTISLCEQKKYQQAILSAEEGVMVNNKNSHLQYIKGFVLYQLNQCQDAIELFDKAISIDPNHVDAINGKGNSLQNLKQYEQAIICYDQVISIDPNYVDAYSNKGLSLYNLKQYEQAIICYDKAITFNRNHVIASFNKGLSLYNLKQYEQAIICYDKVILIDPNYFNAYFNKSFIPKIEFQVIVYRI